MIDRSPFFRSILRTPSLKYKPALKTSIKNGRRINKPISRQRPHNKSTSFSMLYTNTIYKLYHYMNNIMFGYNCSKTTLSSKSKNTICSFKIRAIYEMNNRFCMGDFGKEEDEEYDEE